MESYCGHCGKGASRRCGHCKEICYCTIECQQADWQFHKLLCKQVEKFKEKPKADVRRAILLPENDDKPVLVWLPVEHEDDEDDGYVSEACVQFSDELDVPSHDRKIGFTIPAVNSSILGSDNPKEGYVSLVCGKRGCGELLDHSVNMMLREDQSGCAPNQCLAHLVGDFASGFHGPIVLLCQTKVENPMFTLDISTSDFTLAIDGLLDHVKTNNISKDVTEPHPRKKVLGIKVSQNPQRFKEVEVPSRHPVFKSGTLCAVTDFSGIPMRMHKYPVGTTCSTANPSTNDKNLDIKLNALGFVVDPSSPNFAKTPATFPNHNRTILLAYADGRPLSISKLQILCDFIKDKLQPILLKAPADCRADLVDKFKVIWASALEGFDAAGFKPCNMSPWGEEEPAG